MLTLRSPLLHFFVIGAVLFGVERASDGGRMFGWNRDTLQVTAEDQTRVLRDLQQDLRRAPSVAERAAVLNQFVDEEVLYREALRLGFDQSDSVVRSRLIQNMRFTAADDAPATDSAALLRDAQRLGMDRSDLVVRRRLVQLVERRLSAGARATDEDVHAYLAMHTGDYQPAPRLRFVQAFLSRDRHPHDLEAAAQGLAATLARDPGRRDAGEPFLLGNTQASASANEIAARYGKDFAQALQQVPRGIWIGPLHSPYGLHFVRVEADEMAPPMDRAQSANAARYALLEARQRAALRDGVAALRARYIIAFDPPPVELGDAR